MISRSSVPYSRAELPQPTPLMNWSSSHHSGIHGNQIQGSYPVTSSSAWATLPRSMSTTVNAGTIPGPINNMPSNHMEYDSTYEESHNMQGSHY